MAASVPERCPGCGAPLEGRSPYLPSYGRYECGSYADPPYETIECVRRQRDAARAEAERWKRKHDALRAAVIKADELIVDAIHRATAMYNHTQDANYESHSDGLDEALMILRQLLAEAGGVE